eukprot:TRINITY_DN2365_c0_g1_i1.p2 TRINITY_DN2365_c0_g1~~TRINITY_DN2365_c0_g1_i1.p2  ORF type:complete len:256 (-),score=100.52 TRINITY_DN2365_c0_g1_i1:158-925(-)
MATLDDKLMGEKLHYYCSSSEDEGEDDGGPSRGGAGAAPPPSGGGGTVNTGPKGVVKDYMRFKQLESEQREEKQREKLELAKKLSLHCRTVEEDEKAKAEEEELEALFDDEFMQMYIEKRMREMELKAASQVKVFGEIIDLQDGDEFLKAIDGEEAFVSILVYIFEDDAEGCMAMYECLKILAADHPDLKILRISASAVGFSNYFKNNGVPALLHYKAENLVASFPKMVEQLGRDFYANDLEAFLIQNGVIEEKS